MLGRKELMRRTIFPTFAVTRSQTRSVAPRPLKKGWVLMELVVMTGILGLAVVACWMIWLSSMQQSRQQGTKESLRHMGAGIRVYYDSWRSFPMAGQPLSVPDLEIPESLLNSIEPPVAREESMWFDEETGEVRRGWCALLAAGGAVLVAFVTIVGFGVTQLKSQ